MVHFHIVISGGDVYLRVSAYIAEIFERCIRPNLTHRINHNLDHSHTPQSILIYVQARYRQPIDGSTLFSAHTTRILSTLF